VGVSYSGRCLGCRLNCSTYGLCLVGTGCMSLLDQSISVVNIVQPNRVGFVGIGDDDYVDIQCVLEFERLFEVLESDLRVWDIVCKTWPEP